jgi:hypothetical protein
LVLNSSTNSTTANSSYLFLNSKKQRIIYYFVAAGIIRPFMIFATEEMCIGQLFDTYIFRMQIQIEK